MAQTQKSEIQDEKVEKEPTLLGAFTAVMIVGLFIIITWAGVFILFNQRF
ncbi:cytochrome c oxidase subunit 2A [Cytobacillus purgationiresistens]|uniref:Cytochrome c oxidase subunit 2A n=1 Tax=Cytobacillus purgationiresistens TaxID=863449 RepID=A0ABU0AJ09_9BACI|nr:cytochrome c oxidase subunit 2A [Cytobacillus purgationiresistens]MDQ0271020.1 hypothetical protein [Cytobacillus purgationiresistens]